MLNKCCASIDVTILNYHGTRLQCAIANNDPNYHLREIVSFGEASAEPILLLRASVIYQSYGNCNHGSPIELCDSFHT